MFAKRGYLLPYHRMLGASDPPLLAAYDALYTRLTLDQRVLTMVEREIVWVAWIATTREKYAYFHFDRATEAGMDNDATATRWRWPPPAKPSKRCTSPRAPSASGCRTAGR